MYILPQYKKNYRGDKDGRGVRCGDHLPPHKYIRNTSTRGIAPIEHLLNADRRPQTSKKARPPTYLGRAKEKRSNRGKRIGTGPAPVGGSCEGGKLSKHSRKPLRGRRWRVAKGGSFGAPEESVATGVWRAKRRDSRTEKRCRAALTSPRGLSAHRWGRRGWELRLGLRSDRRERTGAGCMNTA